MRLVVKDDALAERLAFIQNSSGATPGPQDCFLVLRGLKTLHLRMQRHCENGKVPSPNTSARTRRWTSVYWPGLPHTSNHAIAAKQMRGFGGMISFTLKGDNMDDATRVLPAHEAVLPGRIARRRGSLLGHPASMTHASIPREERLKNGLADTLIRLSVGLEDAEDLVADLAAALG